jgi:hypothetical protein
MTPKRRRWIVAVIATLAVAYWLLWPQGDARFVGRWELLTIPEQDQLVTLELGRWGTGWIRDDGENYYAYFDWKVDDSLLILKPPDQGVPAGLHTVFVQIRNQFERSGNQPAARLLQIPAAWRIVDVSPDRIQITPAPGLGTWILGTGDWTLRRVGAE